MNPPRFALSALAVAVGLFVALTATAQEKKKTTVYTGTLKGIRILRDGDRDTITIGQKIGEVILTVTEKTKILIAPAKEGDEPTPGTVKDLQLELRVRAETVPGGVDTLDTILIYPKKAKPKEKEKE